MMQGKRWLVMGLLALAGCTSTTDKNTDAILNSSVTACPDVYAIAQLSRVARDGGVRHVIRGVDAACLVDDAALTLRYTIQPRLGVIAPRVDEERVYQVDYLVVAVNPAGEVFRRFPFTADVVVPAGQIYGNLTTLLNLDFPLPPATQQVYIALPD